MKDNEAENLIYNAETGDHNERMRCWPSLPPERRLLRRGKHRKSNSIGTAAAEEKALLDAGVSSADANFGYTDFDFEKGSFVYEVEFTANGIEWEYVIKASDGTVLAARQGAAGYVDAITPGMDTGDTSAPVSEESRRRGCETPETSTPETSTPVQGNRTSDWRLRKNAALADAGVRVADATFTEQKRDRE